MDENEDNHRYLFDQVSSTLCSKPIGMGPEDCFSSRKKSICQQYGKCRLFEKTVAQLDYVLSSTNEQIFLSACPGSGKTEVVGLKAAYEIKTWRQRYKGMSFLTFTNNAASVIRNRITQVSGSDAVGYPHYVGTIDSWLHRYIAHPYGHLVTGFLGKDGDRSIRLVDNSSNVGFLSNYQTKYPFNRQGEIKANKYFYDLLDKSVVFWSGNNGLDTRRNTWHLESWQQTQLEEAKKKFLKAGFATYQDIELICHKVLNDPIIAKRIAQRFSFMIIDECQDLSTNQLVLLSQLIDAGILIHFVGDLDQSIYSFKGVNPNEINTFIQSREYNQLELSDNFRSPQPIVDLSSHLVNKSNITGRGQEVENPMCVYLTYSDEADMATLPSKFAEIVASRDIIKLDNSAILARNYGIIGKIRSHGNSGQKSKAYYPAIAIQAWKGPSRSLEQTEEAVLLMGKYLSECLFPSQSSNSKSYYCPEGVSSAITWRIFISRVLHACSEDNNISNLQQKWAQWGIRFRDEIVNILQQCAQKFDDINLPNNIRSALGYRIPNGQSNKVVQESLGTPSNSEKVIIRITTIHKTKGETLDAVLLVSSMTLQGGGSGHWHKWVEDPKSENARFAYVACSRPKYLLVWAIPENSLDGDYRKSLTDMGFSSCQ